MHSFLCANFSGLVPEIRGVGWVDEESFRSVKHKTQGFLKMGDPQDHDLKKKQDLILDDLGYPHFSTSISKSICHIISRSLNEIPSMQLKVGLFFPRRTGELQVVNFASVIRHHNGIHNDWTICRIEVDSSSRLLCCIYIYLYFISFYPD